MHGVYPWGVMPFDAAPDEVLSRVATPENVLFLSPRDSDLATMTASTGVPSLPVTNLQNQEPSRVWRTTSAISQSVDITLAAPKACNALAVAAFNMGDAGVWRLKAYASAEDVGGVAALDSGWQSVWPAVARHADPAWGPEVALLRVDNENAYRYWRVEFSDPGAGMTYLEIGRLALGRAIQPSINCDWGGGLGFVPNDVQEPNGYGQIFTEERRTNRTMEMTWSALGKQETETTAMELSRLRGMAGDLFVFLDPGEIASFHRYSMQALFTGRHDYKAQPVWAPDSDGVSRWCWGFTMNLIQKL